MKIMSCLKPTSNQKEPQEELKETFITLLCNLYTYLFECSSSTIDKINTDACWHHDTINETAVTTEESNTYLWCTHNNGKHEITPKRKTEVSKARRDFDEGIQIVAKSTQDVTIEACRHMKTGIVQLNKNLELAIEESQLNKKLKRAIEESQFNKKLDRAIKESSRDNRQ